MISILLLLTSMLGSYSDTKPMDTDTQLIYFGDPMCSWCYGFSPEMTKVKNGLPSEVSFELVMGGLRPNGQQTMGELSDFLRQHWEEINHLTGQPFSYDILDQQDFVYNTEPACRAVVTVKNIAPGKTLSFFAAVQKSFYQDNKDTGDINTYLEIADKLGIDRVAFESNFNSVEKVKATKKEFTFANQLGVTAFPSLLLKKGNEYHLLTQGYQKSDVILEAIEKLMKE